MKYFILGLFLLKAGCATIVKSERQSVQFVGGPDGGGAKINLPDGSYEMTGPQNTFIVTRSREDIPISVTCNGKIKMGTVKTRFDIFLGGLGNLIFGGIIGWIIDGSGNKAYDPVSPYNISSLCDQTIQEQNALK